MRQCIEHLGLAYNLHILPLMSEYQDPIRESTNGCNSITIVVAWSLASSHQTTEPHACTTPLTNTHSEFCQLTPIREHLFKNPGALLPTAFTTLPCLNRTDFETLRASFVSFPMIARVDAVQLTRLPGFDPSAWAAGDALEPPRFRRADQQRQRRPPAWLVASALMVGPSPTVPEMPSVGSGKAKVHRRQTGRAQHDRPGAARECPGTPEAPLRHDLNASFPPTPRCRTSVRISPLRHTSASPPPPCRTP
ncbi:hypothetical protein EDB85DRAFT_2293327 [Lactarius pseudohatsudake]|nr:hypothetical protein EDB85DRAFT_2293327 [Lactarius pseudohatsudake]